MPDPEKMIKVLQQSNNKLQHYYLVKYKDNYSWWKANETILRQCAIKMDALVKSINFGNSFEGNDKQLVTVIADVQQRIWEALYNLNIVTRTILSNVFEASYIKKQTEERIEMYKKMKVVE